MIASSIIASSILSVTLRGAELVLLAAFQKSVKAACGNLSWISRAELLSVLFVTG